MNYKTYEVRVYDNGDKAWYLNGKQHREDGPAIEYADGTKFWYLNDKRHRENGPAIEWANGSKSWWLNDKRHREDGPAVEYTNGTKEWWLNGERLTQEEFNRRVNPDIWGRSPQAGLCEGKIVEIEGKKYKLVSV